MAVELRCKRELCCTPLTRGEFHKGPNSERGWTWWKHWRGMTCPAHYAYGLERERQAERTSDG